MGRDRKRPKDAPTHVVDVILDPSPAYRSVMGTRFDAGVRVNTACLGEALHRTGQMRDDPASAAACSLPRQTREQKEARGSVQGVPRPVRVLRSALMSYASSLRVGWVRKHVFAQEAQVLGARAYEAVNRWLLSQGGKPRFKSVSRGLHSMQCKDGLGALRPVLSPDGALARIQWGRGLSIPPRGTPPGGQRRTARRAHEREVAEHIRAGRVLLTRIVRTRVQGRWSYRAQLIVDAPAPVRHPVGEGLVGLEKFCAVLRDNQRQVRRLRRTLDRQHRAGSPACFDATVGVSEAVGRNPERDEPAPTALPDVRRRRDSMRGDGGILALQGREEVNGIDRPWWRS